MRLVVVVSSLLYFVALLECDGCLEKERIGLLEIKSYILSLGRDERNELELGSWVENRSSDCCSWNRVKCSNISSEQHVTHLFLDSLNSRGAHLINGSLFSPFQELLSLDLSRNDYHGWTNTGFPRLMKLENLKLSDNSMNGILSDMDIQNLQSLKVLDLGTNTLYGSIEGLCEIQDLIELGLNSNRFSGEIPECLSIFRNLQVLDLSQNQFSGNFPSFIGNMTSLSYLSLFDNNLQGSFSLNILANHSKLQVLYISATSPKTQVETENEQWFPTFQLKSLILRSCNLNLDKGSVIPSFLQYQKELQYIDISHNKLVGAFPNWLIQNNSRLKCFLVSNNLFDGKLELSSIRQNITWLDISNNNVSGSLPKDIGTFLPVVRTLNLSTNNFEGSIPTSIGEMQELSFLDLSHNHFSGELPDELAIGCIRLQELRLSNNLFHGNIPKFSNFTNLAQLFVNNNNLNCTLKEVLQNLNGKGLMTIDISSNSISGSIPSSIAKLSRVWVLLMGNNQLEGEIPIEFSNLMMLFVLDISQNRLFGSISHVNPSILRVLYLQKNAFSGSIPLRFFESPSLTTLDLRDNNFSGNIPYTIDRLSELRVLLLGGNNFSGYIPVQLCQLQKITLIDLSRNKLKGSIPSCFNNISFGLEENHDSSDHTVAFSTVFANIPIGSVINASVSLFMPSFDHQNENTNTIVEFVTKNNIYTYRGFILKKMTGLDLSCNMLRGSIPFQIGDLQKVRVLNLSHNYLSGSIPNTFSNLAQIESLDLSYNNLSGEIPFQMVKLNRLAIFNVSFNNLSGVAPSTGQFGTFVEDSYLGNPFLCAELLKHTCEASPPSQFNHPEGKETVVDMTAFYWTFAASYIVILMGFAIVLCINASWRMTWFYFIAKIIHACFPTLPLY
ncbi:hypothetical protein V8G54_010157 [Vigna mungo]|uniref:Leucine-rich repeat-containing N-terminal plant-type domain-containing protein n=1 Tax=Vigna mungo TaxID=3915 RepID=A0AAQ3NVW5_VIGMU